MGDNSMKHTNLSNRCSACAAKDLKINYLVRINHKLKKYKKNSKVVMKNYPLLKTENGELKKQIILWEEKYQALDTDYANFVYTSTDTYKAWKEVREEVKKLHLYRDAYLRIIGVFRKFGAQQYKTCCRCLLAYYLLEKLYKDNSQLREVEQALNAEVKTLKQKIGDLEFYIDQYSEIINENLSVKEYKKRVRNFGCQILNSLKTAKRTPEIFLKWLERFVRETMKVIQKTDDILFEERQCQTDDWTQNAHLSEGNFACAVDSRLNKGSESQQLETVKSTTKVNSSQPTVNKVDNCVIKENPNISEFYEGADTSHSTSTSVILKSSDHNVPDSLLNMDSDYICNVTNVPSLSDICSLSEDSEDFSEDSAFFNDYKISPVINSYSNKNPCPPLTENLTVSKNTHMQEFDFSQPTGRNKNFTSLDLSDVSDTTGNLGINSAEIKQSSEKSVKKKFSWTSMDLGTENMDSTTESLSSHAYILDESDDIFNFVTTQPDIRRKELNSNDETGLSSENNNQQKSQSNKVEKRSMTSLIDISKVNGTSLIANINIRSDSNKCLDDLNILESQSNVNKNHLLRESTSICNNSDMCLDERILSNKIQFSDSTERLCKSSEDTELISPHKKIVKETFHNTSASPSSSRIDSPRVKIINESNEISDLAVNTFVKKMVDLGHMCKSMVIPLSPDIQNIEKNLNSCGNRQLVAEKEKGLEFKNSSSNSVYVQVDRLVKCVAVQTEVKNSENVCKSTQGDKVSNSVAIQTEMRNKETVGKCVQVDNIVNSVSVQTEVDNIVNSVAVQTEVINASTVYKSICIQADKIINSVAVQTEITKIANVNISFERHDKSMQTDNDTWGPSISEKANTNLFQNISKPSSTNSHSHAWEITNENDEMSDLALCSVVKEMANLRQMCLDLVQPLSPDSSESVSSFDGHGNPKLVGEEKNGLVLHKSVYAQCSTNTSCAAKQTESENTKIQTTIHKSQLYNEMDERKPESLSQAITIQASNVSNKYKTTNTEPIVKSRKSITSSNVNDNTLKSKGENEGVLINPGDQVPLNLYSGKSSIVSCKRHFSSTFELNNEQVTRVYEPDRKRVCSDNINESDINETEQMAFTAKPFVPRKSKRLSGKKASRSVLSSPEIKTSRKNVLAVIKSTKESKITEISVLHKNKAFLQEECKQMIHALNDNKTKCPTITEKQHTSPLHDLSQKKIPSHENTFLSFSDLKPSQIVKQEKLLSEIVKPEILPTQTNGTPLVTESLLSVQSDANSTPISVCAGSNMNATPLHIVGNSVCEVNSNITVSNSLLYKFLHNSTSQKSPISKSVNSDTVKLSSKYLTYSNISDVDADWKSDKSDTLVIKDRDDHLVPPHHTQETEASKPNTSIVIEDLDDHLAPPQHIQETEASKSNTSIVIKDRNDHLAPPHHTQETETSKPNTSIVIGDPDDHLAPPQHIQETEASKSNTSIVIGDPDDHLVPPHHTQETETSKSNTSNMSFVEDTSCNSKYLTYSNFLDIDADWESDNSDTLVIEDADDYLIPPHRTQETEASKSNISNMSFVEDTSFNKAPSIKVSQPLPSEKESVLNTVNPAGDLSNRSTCLETLANKHAPAMGLSLGFYNSANVYDDEHSSERIHQNFGDDKSKPKDVKPLASLKKADNDNSKENESDFKGSDICKAVNYSNFAFCIELYQEKVTHVKRMKQYMQKKEHLKCAVKLQSVICVLIDSGSSFVDYAPLVNILRTTNPQCLVFVVIKYLELTHQSLVGKILRHLVNIFFVLHRWEGYHDFIDQLLETTIYKLCKLRKQFSLSPNCIINLTALHLQCCLKRKDSERVNELVLDALYTMHYSTHIVIQEVLKLYPHFIPKATNVEIYPWYKILCHCILGTVDQKSAPTNRDTSTLKLLLNRYGYKVGSRMDKDIKDELFQKLRSSNLYMLETSFLIFAKRHPWHWTYKFIVAEMLEIIDMWKRKECDMTDKAIGLTVRLVVYIARGFDLTLAADKLKIITEKLISLTKIKTMSAELEEEIVDALIAYRRIDFNSVVSVILNWKLKYGLKPKQIKYLLESKPSAYWRRLLFPHVSKNTKCTS